MAFPVMNASEGTPGRWWALAGLCTAAGLVWLAFADESIALPTISKELSLSLTDLQWTNHAFSPVWCSGSGRGRSGPGAPRGSA
jgi:hypothetical protein